MNRRALTALSLSAAALLAPLSSARAGFSYGFFFGQPNDVSLVGDCTFDGSIKLTAGGDQAGALWHNAKQRVDTGFTTTFQFQLQRGPLDIFGDGFAFVLQDSPGGAAALGAGGSGIGFAAGADNNGVFHEIARSIAIEFDTFGFEDEFATPHVSVQTRGALPNDSSDSASIAHAVLSDLNINIEDDRNHTATIQYAPPANDGPGVLEVYIDSTLVLSTPLNLRDVLGADITDDGMMYAGFTAATGLADTTHQISAWALDDDAGSCAPPHWHLGGSGSGGLGSTAEIGVQFVGTRPMTFTWLRNEVEITDSQEGRIEGLGTDTLRINDFQLADAGIYKLRATNACGTQDAFDAPMTPCRLDFNADGAVDPDDLSDYIGCFFTVPRCDRADYNFDGVVDPDDLSDVIAGYFGNGCQ